MGTRRDRRRCAVGRWPIDALGLLVIVGFFLFVRLVFDSRPDPQLADSEVSLRTLEDVGTDGVSWACPAPEPVTGAPMYRRLTLNTRGLTLDVVSWNDVLQHTLHAAPAIGWGSHWTFEDLEQMQVEHRGTKIALTKRAPRLQVVEVAPWPSETAAAIVQTIRRTVASRAESAMSSVDARRQQAHLSNLAENSRSEPT